MPISSRAVGYETQSTHDNLNAMSGEEQSSHVGRLKKKAKEKRKLGETVSVVSTAPEQRDV